MIIGYARVSTEDQNLDGQLDALKAAGAEKVFADKITGTARSRPELDRLLDQLRQGDVITVTKYDRLARSLRDLLDIVDTIQAQGAGFRSLAEDIDTTTPAGRLVFHVFASIAQFERERISERTKEGLEAARKRGRVGGRPPALSAAQRIEVRRMRESLRSDRDERTRLSLDCIGNYETALSLLGSKSELEVQLRSRILNNLTNGYYALGTSTKGEESRGYLDKGIQVCEECISLRPRENNPTSWARAQNALGNVLHERAVKTNGKDSHHYFHSAEQAYRKYLEVFTRSEYPLEWAQTNENLSIIAINLAGHDSCRNPKNDLLIARTRILECLEVYNPTNMPMLKQKAEEILSVIDGKVRDLGDKN